MSEETYNALFFVEAPDMTLHIEAAWRHFETLCERGSGGQWEVMDEDFTPGKNQRICPTCKKEAKKIIAEFDRKKADIVREHYPRVPRRRS